MLGGKPGIREDVEGDEVGGGEGDVDDMLELVLERRTRDGA